ncbi:metallophosphoesterase [Pontibacter harenae]|uniref:metallophosphoesterase n=1 Tax=Pontibacter harenae TaxID=2894083 RepID=UPI001E5FC2E3|nr:metallophosphoesterase [Pontibacter harenae]MCC9166484.1 metallophosphoesterase [Pontibacter harenae]
MRRTCLYFFRPILLLLLITAINSCVTTEPYYSSEALDWEQQKPDPQNKLLYSVFLIGDVGAPDLENGEPSLKLMRAQMDQAGEQSATIFLGDNVYHNGLPEPGSYDREISEARLNAQLDILKGYAGEKYMIPGNHDWNHSGRGGMDYVVRQQRYVNEYLSDENIVTGGDFYVPGNACPGPYEVKISDDLVLIALDSEWWLHAFDRPYGTNSSCGAATEAELLVQLEDIIEKNSGSDIMVVAHHPLMSRGAHGGFFSLKDHFFPLTMLRDWMYLPLPVIGSIYPFARKYGGILQDIPHPRYQAYIEGLLNIFEKYDNIVYAAGHEHALEYFKHGKLPHIVSGSGCKTQYIDKGGDVTYVQKVKGFAKVLYYDNGEAWTEFWEPLGDGSTGRVTFRTQLYTKRKRDTPLASVTDNDDYTDSTVTVVPNKNYMIEGFREKLLGSHYRKEWNTPVTVPVLDMAEELGGLTPYQKGGGTETITLKVRTPEAREYTLRTVNKDPVLKLPLYLRNTPAKAMLQDQISAQHPYAALAVTVLADSANIFHANPKLFYVPDTPYLRQYRDEFSNKLVYLEEDADENHEDIASLGNAKNLVGTEKMLTELQEDNDNQVDELAYGRARLFDMLIGDWDRHEGQWRWVEQEKDGPGDLYIPVPEDRDQAFFKADGVLPWLAKRRWSIQYVQNFDYEIGDIIGLNLNALTLDRTLTSSLSRQDWVRLAQDLKANITDQVIEEAINQWPDDIVALSGKEIKAKLKARRDQLPQVAERFYEQMARMVDVAGSAKHERFVVERLNNSETRLTVYKISKEGELRDTLYQRTFYTNETKEIRLYGLGGLDQYEVKGEVEEGIIVRIIGGGEEDSIVDNSRVRGLRKHTVIYDSKEGNKISFGPETKDETSEFLDVHFYDRDNYRLPKKGPVVSVEYNKDDGPFIGAGYRIRTQKFRKSPYASEQKLTANYAFNTQSFNFTYIGDFREVFRNWHLNVMGLVQGPQYQRNFYGFGNFTTENEGDDGDRFYRVRYNRIGFDAHLYRELATFFRIGIGPTYDRFRVRNDGRQTFLLQEARAGHLQPGTFNLEDGTFNSQHYVGISAFANMDVIGDNNEANPRIGMRWHNSISYNKQVDAEQLSFTNISSAFSFYLTPNFPFRLTWAGRIGAAHNFGDFRFYQANALSGQNNLRGYRRARFSGRSMVYSNFEARLQLFDANLYLTPARFGVLGFFDAGRVYYEGDTIEQKFFKSLHTGVGGGIWIDLLDNHVATLSYAVGDGDSNQVLASIGFLF